MAERFSGAVTEDSRSHHPDPHQPELLPVSIVDVAEEQVKDVIMLPGPAQQIDEATKLLLPGPDYNAARAEKLLTALATDGSGKAAYVLGMHLLNQPQVGRASLNRGIKYLEQAVAADVVDAYYALASHGRLEYLAGYFAKESDQQKAKDRATEIFIQHLKNDTAIDVQLLNPVVLKNLASITRRLTEMHTAILNTGTSSHAERVAFSLKYLNFILFLTRFRFFEYMSFYEASDLPYEFGLSIGKKIAVDFKKTYYGKNQRWIDHVMDDALYDNILRIKFIEPTIDDLKFL